MTITFLMSTPLSFSFKILYSQFLMWDANFQFFCKAKQSRENYFPLNKRACVHVLKKSCYNVIIF